MRRVVWLDGALVDPDAAALSIDDPAVRWGEGLFETMRAEDGRIPLLERHLARMAASAAALGLPGVPGADAVREAVGRAVAAAGPGPARVRVTASERPTLLVEVAADAPLPPEPPAASAASVRGAWSPGNALAEHKTLAYAGHRLAQRRAEAAGADHALLLDADGALGEAAIANVVCAIGGRAVTPPAHGLLGGVALGVVGERIALEERRLPEGDWRAAEEIVLTNAVRGAVAVVRVDGAPVGAGVVGPLARRVAGILRAVWGRGAAGEAAAP